MLKRFILLLLCCSALITTSHSQVDSVRISLLTYSPLPAIYGAFGHSAIRIQDYQNRTDVIYNYGIFDFGEPNFVWKFLRGKLEYQLGKESTQRVFHYYGSKGNRQIWEQEFNLTQTEKSRVFKYLEDNYKPENRKYLYDFFFDNCATRIRDILQEAIGADMRYKSDLKTGLTLRELLDVHVASRPWDDFGMDLLLGLPADEEATYQEQMFLPGYLSINLQEGIELTRRDSLSNETKEALMGDKILVLDGENYMNQPSFLTPFVAFGILCLLMLVLTILYTHNRLLAILDAILFFLLGFVGIFLLFMWLGTDHDATQWNLNILWANPCYLFLFPMIGKRKERYMKIGYGMAFLSGVIILLGWGMDFPQDYHSGILPIILMMLVRSGSVFLALKRKKA